MIMFMTPTTVSALLKQAPAGASRYLIQILNLPVPTNDPVQEAQATGDTRDLAPMLKILLNPDAVVGVAGAAVAIGADGDSVTVTRNGSTIRVNLNKRLTAFQAVARALIDQLGRRDEIRMLSGRWTSQGKAEHQILVRADDVEEIASDLLGARGPRLGVRS